MASDVSALVSQFLMGNQSAFTELVCRYHGKVFGLCMRMLGHRQEAEDATQDTFVRVANNLHSWDNERTFEPWLMTIAGNRCRTLLSKRIRRPKMASLDFSVADDSHDERRADFLAEEMNRILSRMKSEHQQAFLMFHQRQMPYAEIASHLGVPLGTVKTWVHRARLELVQQLQQREVIVNRNNELSNV